ncbi:MAG TPA: ribosome silencing factor [Candidatus Methylomirabilis sp.]|nr:ribosome silencing factor [Candidatus Methylomirabilis sp.]
MKFDSLPHGVRLAVEAAQNKKASGIIVLDLSGVGAFTDFFVICTGFSTPQVQAICTEIEEQLEKHLRRSPRHREGYNSAEWALLDFGGFIVHVFSEQARRYYDLERLWRASPRLEIPDEPETAARNHAFGQPHASGEAYSK